MEGEDRFLQMFRLQGEFMELLRQDDKLPEYPVDLASKPGQRLVRETFFYTIEELMEASFCMRNKVHRRSDVREIDRAHYLEELGDSLAFFMEACILSGVTPEELHQEYIRKNGVVRERLERGY